MTRFGKLLALALGALILLQWLLALQVGLGRDAGALVPSSRDVLRGAVPIVDFDIGYPPGSLYMFALLGERLLMSPVALKLFMLVLIFAASWLLYRVLLARGQPRSEALLWALFYHAWVIGLDGTLIYLEPLQNLFLIATWLALLKWPDRRGVSIAGLAAGAALMVKQYSLLIIPAFTLLAFTGTGKMAGRRSWSLAMIFLACVPIPFAAFVVATWQDPVEAFRVVSTFRGSAASYASGSLLLTDGLRLAERIFDHSATLLLLPVTVGAAWHLSRERTAYRLALFLALGGSLAPLLVAQYPHYIQLFVPWAVLALSDAARAVARHSVTRPEQRRSFRHGVMAVALLVLAPLLAKSTLLELLHATSKTDSRSAHVAVARQVADALPEHRDILVINRPWLYLLADLTPPDLDYRWPTFVGFEACDGLRDRAQFVVLMPFRGEDPEAQGHRSVAAAREWLLAGGLELFESLPSPWGTPIEIYRGLASDGAARGDGSH